MNMAREHPSGRTYVLTWIALLVLTGLSFGLSFVHLGDFALLSALEIAVVKSAVVAVVFMHLVEAMVATRMIPVITFLFVLLLCLAFVGDVAFR